MLLGGIEAGGTKFVCVVGTGPDDIRAEQRVPTTSPEDTLAAALHFFQAQQAAHGPLDALGIGSFGPIDLHPGSGRFGFITSTPKPGWANTDLAGVFRRGLGVPVAFDTDVNAAALGEWRYGAARGLDTFLYLTVGTGIGGGALVNGRLLHGLVHPEMGHVRVARDRSVDPFPGACPFHGDCLEGLASGAACLRVLLHHAPEAVFCANDLMALGAMDAAPTGLPVFGFDGIPDGALARYRLTTMAQDADGLAEAALALLDRPGEQRLIPARLMVRDKED